MRIRSRSDYFWPGYWCWLVSTRKTSSTDYAALKEIAPNDPQAYQALGLFYLSIGEKEKAVTEFRDFSHSKPADISVKSHTVETLLDLGRTSEAKALNREILRTTPDDPNALVSSGRILIAERFYPEAVTALQQAVKSNPKSATAYYLLGVAQESLGFADLAKSSFAHALDLEPQRADAELALANLDVRTRETIKTPCGSTTPFKSKSWVPSGGS